MIGQRLWILLFSLTMAAALAAAQTANITSQSQEGVTYETQEGSRNGKSIQTCFVFQTLFYQVKQLIDESG
jgi:hypothetical protein